MLKETIKRLNQVQRGTLYKKSAKIMRYYGKTYNANH